MEYWGTLLPWRSGQYRISNNQTDVTSFSEDGRGVKWLCNEPKPYPYSNQNNKINPKRINFRN